MKIPIIDVFGMSDIGNVRLNNEDVIASLPSHQFFAIADGMGGHKAGEVAAKEATDELCLYIKNFLDPQKQLNLNNEQIVSFLTKAITKANQKVFNLGKENINFRGMGTTLCCAYLYDEFITYANVGDSRLYLYRENVLSQLTKDHSLIAELSSVAAKKKDVNKIFSSYKNIITKAIGTHISIVPSINSNKYLPKDIYFMCTDGLSDYLSAKEIVHILNTYKNKELLVNKLIEAAKNNGSRDNISTLIIEVQDFK